MSIWQILWVIIYYCRILILAFRNHQAPTINIFCGLFMSLSLSIFSLTNHFLLINPIYGKSITHLELLEVPLGTWLNTFFVCGFCWPEHVGRAGFLVWLIYIFGFYFYFYITRSDMATYTISKSLKLVIINHQNITI